MLPTSAAERHRTLAAGFSSLLDGVTDWDAPTPVPEWTVHDLVSHMVWFHDFVHTGSPFGWTRRRDPASDPRAAWEEQTAAVQLILDDPAQAESHFAHPHLPPATLAETADRFYVADVFMHAWDLARATGQELELDPEHAAGMLAGMRQMEDVLRGSGQYGPAHPVSEEAAPGEQLMAFVGRDPEWRAA